ncbi:hypothetical protein AB3G33_14205 [Flavobacterium sp. WC2421]
MIVWNDEQTAEIIAAYFQAAFILCCEVFFGMEGRMTDWKSIM